MFRKEHTERTLQKKSYLLTYLYGENIFGAPLGRCSIDRREVDNEGTVRGSLRYKLTDVISMDAPLPLHMVDEAVMLPTY